MGDEVDLNSYVHHGDILAAIRSIHGPQAKIIEYQSSRATTSVQGFTSLMLRVKVQVQVTSNDPQSVTCSLIVKRLPVMEAQLEMLKQSNIFEREITYFDIVAPILLSKTPNLALVKSFVAHGTTLILEDLCQTGFETLGKSMDDVGEGLMNLSHIRMAVRKLAQLHAASLDTDWLKLLPKELERDELFEQSPYNFFKTFVENGTRITAAAMREYYPLDKYSKYANWMLSSDCFEKMKTFAKPSSKFINVLNHGDFWANNMMFKLDPKTKEPLDFRFIDLQIFRVAPPTTDLHYFMYSSTDKKFRDENEENILRAYVESFNASVCRTPDLLSYETLREMYEENRLFGVLFAITMKPMKFMEVMPGEGEELSTEKFDAFLHGNQTASVLKKVKADPMFKNTMCETIDEFMVVMDKDRILK